MKTTHIGLVKISGNQIIKVRYFLSKFERELGDRMTIDGEEFRVGVIADDRELVIQALNSIISQQNSIIRQENKLARIKNRKANYEVDKMFSDIMNDAIKMLEL